MYGGVEVCNNNRGDVGPLERRDACSSVPGRASSKSGRALKIPTLVSDCQFTRDRDRNVKLIKAEN